MSVSLYDAPFPRYDPTSCFAKPTSCSALSAIFGFFSHIWGINSHKVAQRVQMFIRFALRCTIFKINAYTDFTIFQSIDWFLINEEIFQSPLPLYKICIAPRCMFYENTNKIYQTFSEILSKNHQNAMKSEGVLVINQSRKVSINIRFYVGVDLTYIPSYVK